MIMDHRSCPGERRGSVPIDQPYPLIARTRETPAALPGFSFIFGCIDRAPWPSRLGFFSAPSADLLRTLGVL